MDDKKTIVLLYDEDNYRDFAFGFYNNLKSSGKFDVIILNEGIYASWNVAKTKNFIKESAIKNFGWIYKIVDKCINNNEEARIAKSVNYKNKFIRTKKVNKKPDKKGKFITNIMRMKNIFLRHNPDIVLCFSPLSFKYAIREKQRLNMQNVQVVSVLPDFYVNTKFVNLSGDSFLVENLSAKSKLVKLGVSENKIFACNMFIELNEVEKSEVDKFVSGLELDLNKTTIFVSGGKFGYSPIKKIFNELVLASNEYNIILDCTSNPELKIYCKQIAKTKGAESLIIVEGENENMLLQVCDVVVCSPESSILLKALINKKPIILAPHFDELQKGIAGFMVENNLVANSDENLTKTQQIGEVINNKRLREKLIANGVKYLENKIKNNIFNLDKLLKIEQDVSLRAQELNSNKNNEQVVDATVVEKDEVVSASVKEIKKTLAQLGEKDKKLKTDKIGKKAEKQKHKNNLNVKLANGDEVEVIELIENEITEILVDNNS